VELVRDAQVEHFTQLKEWDGPQRLFPADDCARQWCRGPMQPMQPGREANAATGNAPRHDHPPAPPPRGACAR
jgi:hypothetical protein